jgi:hypothetical protein
VNTDPHAIFLDFLKTAPRLDGPDQAQLIFEHLTGCEDCAKKLPESQMHAELLLETVHPPAELTFAAREEVAKDQAELLVFGDAILNRLAPMSPAMKAAMEAPLPAEARNELWTLPPVETPRLRAALACSESALALGSFLSLGRGDRTIAHLTRDRLLLNQSQLIPDQYFAMRIAAYASIPEDVALNFWHSLVDVMIEGKVGFSGLFASLKSSEEVSLALVDDDAP